MDQTIDMVSSREDGLLERMVRLHREYTTALHCISRTKNDLARMEGVMLQGEQAVDALVGFIASKKMDE